MPIPTGEEIQNTIAADPLGLYGVPDSSDPLGLYATSRQFTIDTTAINDSPATARDMYNLLNGMDTRFTGPIQINTTVELDGEKLGESMASYQDGQITTTNGRQ